MGFQRKYVIENVLSQSRNFSSPTTLLNLEINYSYRMKNIFNFDHEYEIYWLVRDSFFSQVQSSCENEINCFTSEIKQHSLSNTLHFLFITCSFVFENLTRCMLYIAWRHNRLGVFFTLFNIFKFLHSLKITAFHFTTFISLKKLACWYFTDYYIARSSLNFKLHFKVVNTNWFYLKSLMYLSTDLKWASIVECSQLFICGFYNHLTINFASFINCSNSMLFKWYTWNMNKFLKRYQSLKKTQDSISKARFEYRVHVMGITP